MPLDNLAVGIDIADGAMTLHQLSVGIGPGRISGDIRLMPRADETLQTRADLQFERVDVSRLVRASGGSQGNGALNGAVHLAGTGRSIAEILGAADGAASFWMLGGDLSSLLVDLAGLRLGSALLSALEGSPTTHVECFLADLALRRGILSTRTLLLDTADAVTEGTGEVDLGGGHTNPAADAVETPYRRGAAHPIAYQRNPSRTPGGARPKHACRPRRLNRSACGATHRPTRDWQRSAL